MQSWTILFLIRPVRTTLVRVSGQRRSSAVSLSTSIFTYIESSATVTKPNKPIAAQTSLHKKERSKPQLLSRRQSGKSIPLIAVRSPSVLTCSGKPMCEEPKILQPAFEIRASQSIVDSITSARRCTLYVRKPAPKAVPLTVIIVLSTKPIPMMLINVASDTRNVSCQHSKRFTVPSFLITVTEFGKLLTPTK